MLELLDPFARNVEKIWRALEAATKPAYFLSWPWIENWLALLPRDRAPKLAVIREKLMPVAAGFVGRRTIRRLGVVPSRALFLNTTGEEQFDELCIEHNMLLGNATLTSIVSGLPRNWDELFLPALDANAFARLSAAVLPADLRLRVDREVPSYYVELDRVRGADYLSLLGSSTRAQVRKAQRAAGALEVEVARDVAHALEIYGELVSLHQRHWVGKGQPGAFADPWFDRFHRRLIEQRHAHGEIQLLRISTGGATIGCLYNLVSNGRVLFYQSGTAPHPDKHVKPGYLCHTAAVEHNAAAGHAVYDLLGGNAQYKRNLSTAEAKLVWARLQRTRPWFALEDRVRAWARAARG